MRERGHRIRGVAYIERNARMMWRVRTFDKLIAPGDYCFHKHCPHIMHGLPQSRGSAPQASRWTTSYALSGYYQAFVHPVAHLAESNLWRTTVPCFRPVPFYTTTSTADYFTLAERLMAWVATFLYSCQGWNKLASQLVSVTLSAWSLVSGQQIRLLRQGHVSGFGSVKNPPD